MMLPVAFLLFASVVGSTPVDRAFERLYNSTLPGPTPL